MRQKAVESAIKAVTLQGRRRHHCKVPKHAKILSSFLAVSLTYIQHSSCVISFFCVYYFSQVRPCNSSQTHT